MHSYICLGSKTGKQDPEADLKQQLRAVFGSTEGCVVPTLATKLRLSRSLLANRTLRLVRSPCRMSRLCRWAMPEATSRAVARMQTKSGKPYTADLLVLNQPLSMPSCTQPQGSDHADLHFMLSMHQRAKPCKIRMWVLGTAKQPAAQK